MDPGRRRHRHIVVAVMAAVLLAIALLYVTLNLHDLAPTSDVFGRYPYVASGRFPGNRVPLRPDKFALITAFVGVLALLVSYAARRREDGRRTRGMRALLAAGVLLVLPLGLRGFALGMALLTALITLAVAAFVIWVVVRWVRSGQ
jgi:hypothetical protein